MRFLSSDFTEKPREVGDENENDLMEGQLTSDCARRSTSLHECVSILLFHTSRTLRWTESSINFLIRVDFQVWLWIRDTDSCPRTDFSRNGRSYWEMRNPVCDRVVSSGESDWKQSGASAINALLSILTTRTGKSFETTWKKSPPRDHSTSISCAETFSNFL